MQVLNTLLLTMAILLLLLNAVKPLPVLPVDEDETSLQELRDLPVEQHEQRKRICGMTWIGCDKSGVKRNLLFIILFFVCLFVRFVVVVVVVIRSSIFHITMDVTLAHKVVFCFVCVLLAPHDFSELSF